MNSLKYVYYITRENGYEDHSEIAYTIINNSLPVLDIEPSVRMHAHRSVASMQFLWMINVIEEDILPSHMIPIGRGKRP